MPEEKKRDKVEGFINELAATVNVCAMYGEKHKLTVGAIDKLHESLNAILSETEETTIGVIGMRSPSRKNLFMRPAQG